MDLIITDGIYPSFPGQGNALMPGLVTEEHVTGWKRVTDAVHEAGGRIVAQLMHSGRVAHENINGGRQPQAPSAIALSGMAHTYDGKQPFPVPHALTEDELPGVVSDFVSAAQNAMKAGFDGVELHGANGYLLQEFLSPVSNTRTDNHGGSPENRARPVIEAFRAVAEASEEATETTASANPVEDSVLTVTNNTNLEELLRLGDYCSGTIADFAAKHQGQTIKFDGNIAAMNPHDNVKTRYDILVGAGDYSSRNVKYMYSPQVQIGEWLDMR